MNVVAMSPLGLGVGVAAKADDPPKKNANKRAMIPTHLRLALRDMDWFKPTSICR
jgi:hypothetical protein